MIYYAPDSDESAELSRNGNRYGNNNRSFRRSRRRHWRCRRWFLSLPENRDKVDQFLRSHGMNIPVREDKPLSSMSIEELATLKERVEDVLAEREVAAKVTAAVEKAAN